jgi:flagellar basal-body rod protein FlgC
MDLMNAMKISATALSAHRTKMNVIADNLANVDTTRTEDGGPFRRKMVVFREKPVSTFPDILARETRETGEIRFSPMDGEPVRQGYDGAGVSVDEIVQSQEDFRLVYNPAHPDADPVTGYVAMPNVDHLTEIADMVVARRSYEASVTAMSNTKSMILKALEIGK